MQPEITCGLTVVDGKLTPVQGREAEYGRFFADLEAEIVKSEAAMNDPATKPYRRKILGQNARKGRRDLEAIRGRTPVAV